MTKNVNDVRRTYYITNPKNGMKFFKMYTPSEAQKIFKATGWKGKIVGKLDLLEDRKKVPYDPNWRENQRGDTRKDRPVRMSDFTRV